MKRVYFGTAKIQALRRVALDVNLLVNLALEENDMLSVYLDVEKKEIILKLLEDAPNGLKAVGQKKKSIKANS